ncbi:MAG: hypothetical protein PHT02_00985 [Tissierellia bacterium]|nr:hypothetical protein [Tissierellia bacterium]
MKSLTVYIGEISKYKNNVNESLIIEPELHLHPFKIYKKVRETIKSLIKSELYRDDDIVILTHSPYVLTTLNNLLYAYTIGQKEPEVINKIISKDYWLNPELIEGYELDENGEKIRDLKNIDGLLCAEYIDEISIIIRKEYSDIFNEECKK